MKKSHEINLEIYQVTEETLLYDYFCLSSQVNAMSAEANYEKYQKTKDGFERLSIFLAQNALFVNSLEDTARFLNAISLSKDSQSSLFSHLADRSNSCGWFDKVLDHATDLSKFLIWLGLDLKLLADSTEKQFKVSRDECLSSLDEHFNALMNSIKMCHTYKMQRQASYNKTKHGKSVFSNHPLFLNNPDQIVKGSGPYFVVEANSNGGSMCLSGFGIPYTENDFKKFTSNIFIMSEVIRDLIVLYALQHYPKLVEKLQGLEKDQSKFRRRFPDLFD